MYNGHLPKNMYKACNASLKIRGQKTKEHKKKTSRITTTTIIQQQLYTKSNLFLFSPQAFSATIPAYSTSNLPYIPAKQNRFSLLLK